jgi:ribonuclease J
METTITIYRGTHQIGGCVTELQVGDSRIIIDFGANLPGTENERTLTDDEIVEKVFPKDDSKAKCEAVLFTHYHGDHYGLYKKVPEGIPMYIGATAKKILEIVTRKLDYINEDKGLEKVQQMQTYNVGQWMKFGNGMEIMPLVVDHSALDAYMFVIKAGGKKILFTGDFREHGIVGENNRFERMVKKYVGKVDILITEGTMLSRYEEVKRNPVQTEEELGRRAYEIFSENHENVVLISSTNLDSIMEIYHAVPNDKAFVCDEYQAEVMLAAIEDKEKYYPKRYCIHKIGDVQRNFYIVGKQYKLGKNEHCYPADWDMLHKKGFVMLARPNRNPKEEKGKFEKILETLNHPKIIYSMWEGYLKKEHADDALINFIKGHEEDKIDLHTSGHAYVETIAKLIEITNPKKIIPMHTECADDFAKIKEFTPYADRVEVLHDGEKYCIDK